MLRIIWAPNNCFQSVKYIECSNNWAFMWGTHESMILWHLMSVYAICPSFHFIHSGPVCPPQLLCLYVQWRRGQWLTWPSFVSQDPWPQHQHVVSNVHKNTHVHAYHHDDLKHVLTCFTQHRIESKVLRAFAAKHMDVSQNKTRILKTTSKTHVSLSVK